MVYSTFAEFREDFEEAQNADLKIHNWMEPVTPDIAWRLYQNANKPALDCQVFGRLIAGMKAKELHRFRQQQPTGDLPPCLVGISDCPF